jgi:acyl carrier protein
MTREEILDVLVGAVNEHSGREYGATDIDLSRPVVDYGLDSLNMMQVLAQLEEELEIDIDLGELTESNTESIDALLGFLSSRPRRASQSV